MPDGSTMDIFGSGGGEIVAQRLTTLVGTEVPLLGQVPLDPPLRSHSDEGTPVVLAEPDSPAAKEITKIAAGLAKRRTSLAGKPLSLGVN